MYYRYACGVKLEAILTDKTIKYDKIIVDCKKVHTPLEIVFHIREKFRNNYKGKSLEIRVYVDDIEYSTCKTISADDFFNNDLMAWYYVQRDIDYSINFMNIMKDFK